MREGEAERRRRFEGLFAAHGSDIVAYCAWRAGSTSDAQDAVAEVFLTAWRRLDDLPDGEAARVWLYATARRVIANQRRSSRRRRALQERLALEAVTALQAPSPSGGEDALVHEALGRLAAKMVARETGFKEGRSIRLLPFGYVAHDEAADPTSSLQAEVTVGTDGVVREITVSWGTSASSWTYTVSYSGLGATPAPTAPRDARPLLRERPRAGE
ncbi:MAG TPA: RNA polymerase sigma factor [Gaiellaceae bacterium]|jgi:DNA-directed RNA polymerase specialized sigma24 family protein|nr:RNA polymerase sigma factor [Gaiellaceae bacterium]